MKIVELKPQIVDEKLTYTAVKVEDKPLADVEGLADKLMRSDFERLMIQQSLNVDPQSLSHKFRFK